MARPPCGLNLAKTGRLTGGPMAISLKPGHLKRYKDIAWLLVKYGRGDLASRAGLAEDFSEEERLSAAKDPKAEELARDLEDRARSPARSERVTRPA